MRLDSQLSFVPPGAPLSCVAGAGVAIPSTNTIDLLGLGLGVSPAAAGQIIGNASVFGEDPGIGDFRAEIEVVVGTAFTTGNSATLNIQYQGAPDNGSSQPGTWVTYAESGAIAAASLTAGLIALRIPFLPAFPQGTKPRFLRLNFAVASATNFTAGTIAFAIVTLVRDDIQQKYAVKNFTVS